MDLPPGTGDAQLTLTQKIHLSGAVIVTTPQDISLIDARKGLAMFVKVNVPVLGIVENMSYYLCPECGHRAEIFKHGGGRRTAEKLKVPFLGEIPLDAAIRKLTPTVPMENRKLLTYHDSFAYFSRRYAIPVLGIREDDIALLVEG